MSGNEGAPAPEIPGSSPETLTPEAAIDAELTRVYQSMLDSLCAMGMLQDEGLFGVVFLGARHNVTDRFRKINMSGKHAPQARYAWNHDDSSARTSDLSFPLDIEGSSLALGPYGVGRELTFSWTERSIRTKVRVNPKGFRSSSELVVSKIPIDGFVFVVDEGDNSEFRVQRGRMTRVAYERFDRNSGCSSTSSRPTLAQFQATDGGKLVHRIEESLKRAAAKQSGSNGTGSKRQKVA